MLFFREPILGGINQGDEKYEVPCDNSDCSYYSQIFIKKMTYKFGPFWNRKEETRYLQGFYANCPMCKYFKPIDLYKRVNGGG